MSVTMNISARSYAEVDWRWLGQMGIRVGLSPLGFPLPAHRAGPTPELKNSSVWPGPRADAEDLLEIAHTTEVRQGLGKDQRT